MCPFCFATVGLVVASAVSTGGLAALAIKVSGNNNNATETVPNLEEGSSQDDNSR
jgi:hypothetical protein